MNPKGTVLINREIVHTKNWPSPIYFPNYINLEEEYKKALAGKIATVMDIAVDESGYLVLGKTEKGGDFLWIIEKEDVKIFMPVIKKYDTIIPAGLTPIEEFEFLAKTFSKKN